MNASGLIKTSLYVGFLFFTMSLIRKLFRRGPKKELKRKLSDGCYTKFDHSETREDIKAEDLDRSASDVECSSEPLLQETEDKDQNLDSSSANVGAEKDFTPTTNPVVDDECEDASTANVDEQQRKLVKKLSSTYNRYRKKTFKHRRKQREVMWMERELEELVRLIGIFDQHCKAMDQDVEDKKLQLESMFSSITMDEEDNIRRKDPISFRKYKNLKSAEEARALMKTIRAKQHALRQLELLSYKKYMTLEHKSEIKEKNNNRFAPLNLQRRNFDHIFKAIRTQIVVADSGTKDEEGVKEPENDASENAQSVIVKNATEFFQRMRQSSIESYFVSAQSNSPPLNIVANSPEQESDV